MAAVGAFPGFGFLLHHLHSSLMANRMRLKAVQTE